jgi:hypothetical protein
LPLHPHAHFLPRLLLQLADPLTGDTEVLRGDAVGVGLADPDQRVGGRVDCSQGTVFMVLNYLAVSDFLVDQKRDQLRVT